MGAGGQSSQTGCPDDARAGQGRPPGSGSGLLRSLGRLSGKPAGPGGRSLRALRWRVLVLVGLLLLLVLQLFLQDGDFRNQGDGWPLQFGILLGLAFALALYSLLVRRTLTAEMLLLLQAFVFCVAAYPQGGNPGILCLFTAIWTAELSLWLARSVLATLLASNALLALLCYHPLPAFGRIAPSPTPWQIGTLLMTTSLFHLLCGCVRHYVVQNGLQAREIENLGGSLGNLLSANIDLQNYALEVGERSTLEECKRLTREIHDGVGYTMVNLKMMLEAATDLSGEGGAGNARLGGLLEQAKQEVQNGLAETRQALRTFRAIDRVKTDGLRHIHRLVQSFSHATGIAVEVSYGNIPWSFGEEINLVIYRILQESMTNAIRHGHATRIQICFWICAGRLLISVDDNGIGVGLAQPLEPGIGFQGMRERLEPLGGELTLGNGLNGFTVQVAIPWPGE